MNFEPLPFWRWALTKIGIEKPSKRRYVKRKMEHWDNVSKSRLLIKERRQKEVLKIAEHGANNA